MKVESDVREKNMASWIAFLKEIADGEATDDVYEVTDDGGRVVWHTILIDGVRDS